MAYTCTVQEKRTFPVSIGSHIFYVEQYQLTGIRKFAEQTTIAGMSVFTNQAIRSRVLHMEGRFLRTDPPAELLLALETALQEQTTFTAVLDGVRYRMCRLSQYRIQEDGHSGTVACQLDCLVSQLEAVEEGSPNIKVDMEDLLSGKNIETPVDEEIVSVVYYQPRSEEYVPENDPRLVSEI